MGEAQYIRGLEDKVAELTKTITDLRDELKGLEAENEQLSETPSRRNWVLKADYQRMMAMMEHRAEELKRALEKIKGLAGISQRTLNNKAVCCLNQIQECAREALGGEDGGVR